MSDLPAARARLTALNAAITALLRERDAVTRDVARREAVLCSVTAMTVRRNRRVSR